MGITTGIQWTDSTWNPVTGCTKVSEGCRNCYIARTLPRQGQDPWKVVLHWDRLDQPRHWKQPRMIFLSLADLFHQDVPREFLKAIVGITLDCPQHTFQFLTKRPERMRDFVRDCDFPPNVWLGVSVEDQDTADERIPLLLQTPAAVRFVSYEPALGPINLRLYLPVIERGRGGPIRSSGGLDWLICGGESGPGARVCCVPWIRSVVQQCKAAGTACFVKQLGANVQDHNDAGWDGDEPEAWPMDTRNEDHPNGYLDTYQGAPVRVRLHDRKGADLTEWPEDLRVQEFPKGAIQWISS